MFQDKSYTTPIAQGFLNNLFRYPERTSLVIQEKEYSYAQLSKYVQCIYNHLLGGGVKDHRIGIYVEDDLFSYAAILALSLYGASYVPLNKSLPAARLQKIIDAADLKIILKSEEVELSPLEFQSLEVVVVQEEAYVMFTSGSTGTPLGVPVLKRNVHALLQHYLNKEKYDFSEKDKFIQTYELSFDVSVFSLFVPLSIGASCYTVPNGGIKYLSILKILMQQEITVISAVPSFLAHIGRKIEELKLPSVRYSFFSGEALPSSHAKSWMKALPNAKVYNCYGPTETTIVCTGVLLNTLSAEEWNIDPLPIGYAFENMNYQISEEAELCFSGVQVFEGYIDGEQDRFYLHNNKRFFKTGDLVEERENGLLVFKGRIDQQVKINGYRIELGEISKVLSTIANCRVFTYVVDSKIISVLESEKFNEIEIRKKLEVLLPNYMLPSQFTCLAIFPLNENGKLDREKIKKLIDKL